MFLIDMNLISKISKNLLTRFASFLVPIFTQFYKIEIPIFSNSNFYFVSKKPFLSVNITISISSIYKLSICKFEISELSIFKMSISQMSIFQNTSFPNYECSFLCCFNFYFLKWQLSNLQIVNISYI